MTNSDDDYSVYDDDDRLSCGCCSCCGCDCPPEDEVAVMTRAEADPIGWQRAVDKLRGGPNVGPVVWARFREEWDRPANSAELAVFVYRRVASEQWDDSGIDLTREERMWLLEHYIAPASKVDAGTVLAALRAGYKRGSEGGSR